MLLRSRFLGGVATGPLFGAVLAADDGTSAAAPASTQTVNSGSDAAVASAPSAAPDAAGVAASSPAATDSAAAPAPAEGAPAATPSATSLLAEATAKPPGETAEGAKPDAAKPDGAAEPKPAAKPEGEKPAAEKPAPAKAEGEKKPDVAAPAPAETEALAETPPARTYEAFKLPEGLKLDDTRVKEFTTVLDDSALSHQGRGQKLMDMFVAEVANVQKARDDYQREVWTKYNDAKKQELRADPVVGGNRMETALGRAKWVIEEFGGTADQKTKLLAELSYTGMGNDAGLVRLLDQVAELLSEGEMVPASARPPKGERGAKNWYPSMDGGAA
jgi:hypothetical protein